RTSTGPIGSKIRSDLSTSASRSTQAPTPMSGTTTSSSARSPSGVGRSGKRIVPGQRGTSDHLSGRFYHSCHVRVERVVDAHVGGADAVDVDDGRVRPGTRVAARDLHAHLTDLRRIEAAGDAPHVKTAVLPAFVEVAERHGYAAARREIRVR